MSTEATRVVPQPRLMMRRAQRTRLQIHTLSDHFRHPAGLGGFLMRKPDGEPGWITRWRGLDRLLLPLRGDAAIPRHCG